MLGLNDVILIQMKMWELVTDYRILLELYKEKNIDFFQKNLIFIKKNFLVYFCHLNFDLLIFQYFKIKFYKNWHDGNYPRQLLCIDVYSVSMIEQLYIYPGRGLGDCYARRIQRQLWNYTSHLLSYCFIIIRGKVKREDRWYVYSDRRRSLVEGLIGM